MLDARVAMVAVPGPEAPLPDGWRAEGGAEEVAMSFFSFFSKKARPAKKDFDWFFARLLSLAEEEGWNNGALPNVDLVLLAGETSLQIEKGICPACLEAGGRETDEFMRRIARTCFFAGVAAWWHWNRNRKAVKAAGMYRTITHEAGIGGAEWHALLLMRLADKKGKATPQGRKLSAFATRLAEDMANELATVLAGQDKEAFATAMAEAGEAIFVGGTIVGATIMPKRSRRRR